MSEDTPDVSGGRLTAGTKLQRIPDNTIQSSPSDTTDYETILEVMEVGDFGAESELKDVTRITDYTKVFLLGLPEGVEFPIRANWIPNSQHQEIMAAQSTGIAGRFRLLLPNGEGEFTFSALTRGWRFPVTANVAQEIRFTMKITGTILLNQGSPA
jgi:hypothetical protein